MNQLILSPDILFRRVGDEGVVVDQREGRVMVVNETALRILELTRELQSIEKVSSKVATEYDASPEVIQQDVETLIDQLNKPESQD